MAREENSVVRSCCDLLRLASVLFWRNNSTPVKRPDGGFRSFAGRKGVADIIAVLPCKVTTLVVEHGDVKENYTRFIGRIVCVEAKSATGRQSPHQKQFQAEVEAAGGIYVLARNVRDLEEVLKREGALPAGRGRG